MIRKWFQKHFTFSYQVVTQTVIPGQKIQKAIDDVSKGEGHSRIVTKYRFPWQHPDTHKRGVVLLSSGEYPITAPIVISKDHTTLCGSQPGQSEIIHTGHSGDAIEIIRAKFIMLKRLFIKK